jgi:hypothetical protein
VSKRFAEGRERLGFGHVNHFGFWILDSGVAAANPKSKIENRPNLPGAILDRGA